MKLEAKDLRIGNLVDVINRSSKVHLPMGIVKSIGQIGLFGVHLYDADKTFSQQLVPEGTSISNITPIPLTKEWLFKFRIHETGYEFGEGNYSFNQYTKYDLYFGWLGEDNDETVLVCEELDQLFGGVKAKLKYVHELQNLMFALTGEELKTTL